MNYIIGYHYLVTTINCFACLMISQTGPAMARAHPDDHVYHTHKLACTHAHTHTSKTQHYCTLYLILVITSPTNIGCTVVHKPECREISGFVLMHICWSTTRGELEWPCTLPILFLPLRVHKMQKLQDVL